MAGRAACCSALRRLPLTFAAVSARPTSSSSSPFLRISRSSGQRRRGTYEPPSSPSSSPTFAEDLLLPVYRWFHGIDVSFKFRYTKEALYIWWQRCLFSAENWEPIAVYLGKNIKLASYNFSNCIRSWNLDETRLTGDFDEYDLENVWIWFFLMPGSWGDLIKMRIVIVDNAKSSTVRVEGNLAAPERR